MLPLEGSSAELRSRIAGSVLTRGDPGFDELRSAWNRAYTHHPALIVVPQSAADVAVAVRHAAGCGLSIAIQATGHGVARPADGAMLIATHRLDRIAVDHATWTARFGAGARWQPILRRAAEQGLTPIAGSAPDVSAVGYTLGGGMGWLARKYGLTSDRVRSIEMVTADGQIRRIGPDRDSDLFWAVRGAGAGSLGVVTAMEIDLVAVPELYAGSLFYPANMARDAAQRYRTWIATAPEELTTSLCFSNLGSDQLDAKSFVVVRGAFIGPAQSGIELLDFWRSWQPPAADTWSEIAVRDIANLGTEFPEPAAIAVSSEWFDELSEELIDTLVRAAFEREPPIIFAELRHAGGAIARSPIEPSAFSDRRKQHVLRLVEVAAAPDQQKATPDSQEVRSELAGHAAGGAYLNFMEGFEKVRRSAEAFEPAVWERLKAVKRAHDPHNLFSFGIEIS